MSWQKDFTVDVFDTDFNGVMRASAILKYLQTAATQQLNDYRPTSDDLREKGLAFLLSSIDVDIKRPLKTGECFTNCSWGCPGRGFTFPRSYRMWDKEGDVLQGISQWALLNFLEKKIVRYDAGYCGFVPETALDIPIPRWKLPKKEDMVFGGTYRVLYGVTDQNKHLNNTYYPDMFTAFIPMEGKWVSHMTIRFIKEAPMGENLSIYSYDMGDGKWGFLSLREDGEINAEALFTVKDL